MGTVDHPRPRHPRRGQNHPPPRHFPAAAAAARRTTPSTACPHPPSDRRPSVQSHDARSPVRPSRIAMAKIGEFAAEKAHTPTHPGTPASAPATRSNNAKHLLEIEGYPVEGVSVGGKETCVIFPTLSLAFDIGMCPQQAISQEFLFVSHGHLDHIGGLHICVAARAFLGLRPPTIFVPACLQDLVARLFEVYRAIAPSELNYNLVPLEVGRSTSSGRTSRSGLSGLATSYPARGM
uniref:Metallo-beta-lactamase domain-containing protein n=1 Tax=Setaria viridis TaxID=4556 RepID=A0A4U6W624_SETVI|nr:hypothetical protein SEVIR_1G011066v2 [Setaria viridis]